MAIALIPVYVIVLSVIANVVLVSSSRPFKTGYRSDLLSLAVQEQTGIPGCVHQSVPSDSSNNPISSALSILSLWVEQDGFVFRKCRLEQPKRNQTTNRITSSHASAGDHQSWDDIYSTRGRDCRLWHECTTRSHHHQRWKTVGTDGQPEKYADSAAVQRRRWGRGRRLDRVSYTMPERICPMLNEEAF